MQPVTSHKKPTNENTQLLAEESGSYFYSGLTSVPLRDEERTKENIFVFARKCARRETTIHLSLVNHVRRERWSAYITFHLFCLHTFYFPFFFHWICHPQYLAKWRCYSLVALCFFLAVFLPVFTHPVSPQCVSFLISFFRCVFALFLAVCCSLSLSVRLRGQAIHHSLPLLYLQWPEGHHILLTTHRLQTSNRLELSESTMPATQKNITESHSCTVKL